MPPLEQGKHGRTHLHYYDDQWKILDEFICYTKGELNTWTLYFDSSKCTCGTWAGILLVYLTNDVIPMEYKLGFDCTNNMVEYEALLLCLRSIALLNIKELNIYI